jgi:hypothetical protein
MMRRRRDPTASARRRRARPAWPVALSCVAASLFLLAAARAQGPAPDARQPAPSQLFTEARAVGDGPRPAAFEFELDGYGYHVAGNGAGRRVKGDQTRLFNLRLEDLGEITGVRFMGYEGNVLLLCAVDYGDEVGGFVYRLEQPSMRARWSREVPAYDIKAVREGGALYLAGYGFVGKLDLRTGLYAWRHGGLPEGQKSRIPPGRFEQPDVSGDAALFRQTPERPGDPALTFRIHKRRGRILEVVSSQ